MNEWTIKSSKSDWINEEERLLNWVETPDFHKQPLDSIAMTFIYTDTEQSVVGMLSTEISLEPIDRSSFLHRDTFLAKINTAKKPNNVISDVFDDWLKKTYVFDDVAIYSVPFDHEETTPPAKMSSLHFSKDVAKIPSCLSVFADLYEITVIMREADLRPSSVNPIKSILKPFSDKESFNSYSPSNNHSILRSGIVQNCPIDNQTLTSNKRGKTKKVRISNDLPKEYIFSKISPVSRRTKKVQLYQ